MADMKKVYDDLIIINLYKITLARKEEVLGFSFRIGINENKLNFLSSHVKGS